MRSAEKIRVLTRRIVLVQLQVKDMYCIPGHEIHKKRFLLGIFSTNRQRVDEVFEIGS